MNNKEFTKRYYLDRSKGDSIKWQRGRKLSCLPMWVADMDFKCDERLITALNDFITKADYGYANLPEDYYDVFINWHQRRNNVRYKREWIRFSKGAVDAMYQIIHAFTQKGDSIMINTPLYPPFKASILQTGRRVVESKMINNDDFFTFNYKDMEKKFSSGKVKMLMLCSPHNPLGRVYKKGELEELFELCHRYHVLICADEVHSDIIMPDQSFVPALSIKEYQNDIVAIIAASKTFSLAVFSHCHIVIPDEKRREKLIRYQQDYHTGSVNVFNALPTYYGYMYGEEWLDALCNVINENYHYIYNKLSKYLEISVLEGSYLLFINLGKYTGGMDAGEFLIEKCHILCNPGKDFDKKYAGWVRMNLATSLSNVKKAVKSILEIIEEKK